MPAVARLRVPVTHELFFTLRLNHTGSSTRNGCNADTTRTRRLYTQPLTAVHPQGLLMHTIIANGGCLKGEVALTSDQPEVSR